MQTLIAMQAQFHHKIERCSDVFLLANMEVNKNHVPSDISIGFWVIAENKPTVLFIMIFTNEHNFLEFWSLLCIQSP